MARNLTKAFSKKRYAVSADGVPLYRGSIVHVIETQDGGKTWSVADEQEVQRTTTRGMVSFQDPPKVWSYCWPLKEMIGDHRLYSDRANAIKECRRRNKLK